MKIHQRIVLILSAILFSGISLKAENASEFSGTKISDEFAEHYTTEDNCTHRLISFNYFSEKESVLNGIIYTDLHRLARLKKIKVKRSVSSYGIKPAIKLLPVLITEQIAFGYSKPHFIPELHSFLFRLTPF